MLPLFEETGNLPAGVHRCTVEEAQLRFGGFQTSDRRPRLWAQFASFLREAKNSQLIEELLLDGSFVTAEPAPNDIDIVVVVPAGHNFAAELPANQYNLLAARRVRRRFGLDIVVVRNGTEQLAQAVEFFAQMRHQPALKKGLLKIKL